MKIFHVTFGLKLGGLETMLVNIANEQAITEDVTIVLINNLIDNDLSNKICNNVKVYNLERKVGSHSPWPAIKLNYLLLKECPDIIHVHAPNVSALLIPSLMKKTIYTVHDVTINNKYFSRFPHMYSIAKCVEYDVKMRSGFEAPVIYNGININEIKCVHHPRSKVFNIVQVSRLFHEKKGQDILIKAVNKLRQKGINNINIDFVGDGISKNYLENLTSELGLNDNVRLLGSKPYSWVTQHLCDYDLLVQPSLFEGFGLTVAEGMAAKIPVLVSDIDGPMEIIDNGKYGLYFSKGNIEECSDMIERIINMDESEIIALTEKAWHHVNENFNIKRTVQRYIEVYKQIRDL